MKLLSWMRTPKQNGLQSSKEFKGDFCCLRVKVSSEFHDIRTNSFSFSGPSHNTNPPGIGEELKSDEDDFCGFLAIGTLGMDLETPKFAASVGDDATEENKEFAKRITEELEKFLEKDIDRRESDEYQLQDCNLFRSKSSNRDVKKKKGLLTRYFNKRQTVQGEFYMEKHARNLNKRIFQKFHETFPLETRNDNDDDSMPKKKDLRKSIQSKVHPVLASDDNKIDDRRLYINRSTSNSRANRKRENWIKTDAAYVVLEL